MRIYWDATEKQQSHVKQWLLLQCPGRSGQGKTAFLRSEGSCSAGWDKGLEKGALTLLFFRRDLSPSTFNLYSDILNTRLLWFLFCFHFPYTFLSLRLFRVCDSGRSTQVGLWFSYHLLVLHLSPAVPGLWRAAAILTFQQFFSFFHLLSMCSLCAFWNSFALCNTLPQFRTF